MGPDDNKSASLLNYEQALRKAAEYCAGSEHCESEVRFKLNYWGVNLAYFDQIVEQLSSQGYIDDKRYATSFAGGKFRQLHWGKIKITAELRQKRINEDLILRAIDGIDAEEYKETARKLLQKKMLELKSDTRENRNKAASYLIGKGFEPELAFSLLNEVHKKH